MDGKVFLICLGCLGLCVPAIAGEREESGIISADGLQWTAETSGEDLRWPAAVEYCDNLELGGHSDWRLPTMDELEALHDPDAEQGIRSPFSIETCCLWSGESLAGREADDGDTIAGQPQMYHWGFMFDGGLEYYAVHIYPDGQALCVRDAELAYQ